MPFPDDVPVLTDGQVRLRAHRPEDATAVLEQASDPLSQRWTTVPVPYSLADARTFVTETMPGGWPDERWAFAVEAPDETGTPRFCGTVELRDEGNRRAEIAYGAHPWARGRGVVDRALRLLLEWGFTERGLRTVVWWANVGNWASRRTAWRLGFSCDGTVERWLPQRGDLLDGWVGTLHVEDERRPRNAWLRATELDGPGLRLRPLADSDVARVVEARVNERSRRSLPAFGSAYTADDARAWMLDRQERMADGVGVTWAVADEDDVLLGAVNLFGLREGRDASIGYWMHPASRGRGMMTTAVNLVVQHGLASPAEGGLGLGRVAARAAVANTASQHVLEANGFTRTGLEHRSIQAGDELVDAVGYELLAP